MATCPMSKTMFITVAAIGCIWDPPSVSEGETKVHQKCTKKLFENCQIELKRCVCVGVMSALWVFFTVSRIMFTVWYLWYWKILYRCPKYRCIESWRNCCFHSYKHWKMLAILKSDIVSTKIFISEHPINNLCPCFWPCLLTTLHSMWRALDCLQTLWEFWISKFLLVVCGVSFHNLLIKREMQPNHQHASLSVFL